MANGQTQKPPWKIKMQTSVGGASNGEQQKFNSKPVLLKNGAIVT